MRRVTETTQADKDLVDVMREAGNFENQFRDAEKPNLLQKDLGPVDVLGKLGFKKIEFEQLEPDMQEALKKSRTRWYGKPIDYQGNNVRPNTIIMANSDGSIVYFFMENKFPNGRADYGWSRLEKRKDGYYVAEQNHDSNIGEVIGQISFLEILNPQDPATYHRYSESDIKIPFVPESAVKETREQIERL